MVYKMQNVLSLHLEPLSYLVAVDKVGKKTVYEKRITTELEKKINKAKLNIYKKPAVIYSLYILGVI